MSRKWSLPGAGIALLTLFIWIFFQYQHPFYAIMQIEIPHGTATEGVIRVQWDSGHGFNTLEEYYTHEGVIRRRHRLPQYAVRAIRFSRSVSEGGVNFDLRLLSCHRGRCTDLPYQTEARGENEWVILPDTSARIRFHPLLAVIQGAAALLLAWVSFSLMGWLRSRQWLNTVSAGQRAGARVAVGCFTATFGMSLVWLLAYWPAAMTFLTLHNWRITRTLEVDYWSPWLFQILLIFCCQIYDSPVTVAVLQAGALALLFSLVCGWCVSRGGRAWIVVPAVCYYVTAPIVAGWSIVLWHDIPFAIGVVSCAVLLYWLCYRKWYLNQSLRFSGKAFCGILIGLILVALLRRNGIVLLGIMPLSFFCLSLIPRRQALALGCSAIMLFGLIECSVRHFLDLDLHTAKYIHPRILSEVQWKMNPLFGIMANAEGYRTSDPQADQQIISRLLPMETIRQHYQVETIEPVMWKIPLQLADQHIDQVNALYYRLVLLNPDIFLRDRLKMFLHNLGFFMFGTSLPEDVLRQYPGEFDTWYLRHEPVSMTLYRLSVWFIAVISDLPPLHLLLLTPVPALLVLCLMLAAFRVAPASALYAGCLLVQVLLLFFVLPGAESRYFFFCIPGALCGIPLIFLEVKKRRRTLSGN